MRRMSVGAMLLAVCVVLCGLQAWGRDAKTKTLYGNAKEGKAASDATMRTFGYHGTTPSRSAFTVKGNAGTAFYLTDGGYFALSNISYKGPLLLNTPFGNALPGIEYKNMTSDPTLPQTFWISDDPINSGYFVIAASDGAGNWWGLTEDCVRRDLLP